ASRAGRRRAAPLPTTPRGCGSCRRLRVEIQRLPLSEEVSCDLALLAGPARAVAHPAEGDVELEARALLVDLDDAGAHVSRECERPPEVALNHRGREAVGSVVRELDRLGVGADREQGGDRAEDLLP